MYTIKIYDKIAQKGLNIFTSQYNVSKNATLYDAVLLRSSSLLNSSFPPSLSAIARAGVGVNNIPIEEANTRGIVVFNTPGANANSVKELVLSAFLLASRHIFESMIWTQSLAGKGKEIPRIIEKQKKEFIGTELRGKTLGIIGLGAIGTLVANAAISLDMHVLGYDPHLSIDSAWRISQFVKRTESLDSLLARSDYLTLHVPLSKSTKKMLNKKKFALMKKNIHIINLARPEIVDSEALLTALKKHQVATYITDFPEDRLLGMHGVLTIPHLGASTKEAEENCAVMAAHQLRDYLEKGIIHNSINFPSCSVNFSAPYRLLIANKNVPSVVGQITSLIAKEHINISDMFNHHKEEIAYTVIDIDSPLSPSSYQAITRMSQVLRARIISQNK